MMVRDDNFMTGQLTLMFMPENNITIGKFDVIVEDKLLTLYAQASCAEGDTYDEKVGADIIRLKLQRKYFTYLRTENNKKRRKLEKQLKALDKVDYDKKLYGVNQRLNFYMKDEN